MTSTSGFHGFSANEKLSSKVLKPPGGECSDIFGSAGTSPVTSDGSGATTPTGRRVSDVGLNTRDRLFGDSPFPESNGASSPGRRASIDRMKSNIFTNGGDRVDSPKMNSPKKAAAEKAVRRNPITGEILDTEDAPDHKPINGHSNGNSNGHSVIEEKVAPTQNAVRIRKPPGGESSGIF